jgi:hypothetical protein
MTGSSYIKGIGLKSKSLSMYALNVRRRRTSTEKPAARTRIRGEQGPNDKSISVFIDCQIFVDV